MASNNKALKTVDEYLKFVQQSFNVGGPGFTDIVGSLNIAAEYIKPLINQNNNKTPIKASPWDVYVAREGSYLISTSERLKSDVQNVQIVADPDKYNKFDLLADAINSSDVFNKAGIQSIYKISDDILDDIYVARDWLKSYLEYQSRLQEFLKNNRQADKNSYLQKELFKLGQSILGRAEELTPYDTGTLRRSGVLMVADGGNSIIIGFTAPYATYVHENLEIRHPYHKSNPDCGGQAKFLETALQEFFPDRQVWTEILGVQGIAVKISINPLYIEYKHYGS